MSNIATETSPKSKRVGNKPRPGDAQTRSSKSKPAPAAASRQKEDEAHREERVTKRERLLNLLSQPEGASIEDMMQATNWQQHSVRGFLAGTVKKKLGFSLISSKAKDDVRHYRIEKRRGR
jgi:hypothetical protein